RRAGDRRHRVVDVDVIARDVPGVHHVRGARIDRRRNLRLAHLHAPGPGIVAVVVLLAVAVRIPDRTAATPLAGRRDDLRTRTEVARCVVVAGAVGVGTAATERMRVAAAVRTGAVGGEPGVLHGGTTDLFDAAVGIEPVQVPDQVGVLVVVVRRHVAREHLLPADVGRVQRRTGAERVAADGRLQAAAV